MLKFLYAVNVISKYVVNEYPNGFEYYFINFWYIERHFEEIL